MGSLLTDLSEKESSQIEVTEDLAKESVASTNATSEAQG